MRYIKLKARLCEITSSKKGVISKSDEFAMVYIFTSLTEWEEAELDNLLEKVAMKGG